MIYSIYKEGVKIGMIDDEQRLLDTTDRNILELSKSVYIVVGEKRDGIIIDKIVDINEEHERYYDELIRILELEDYIVGRK